jgi:hypothetical protein
MARKTTKKCAFRATTSTHSRVYTVREASRRIDAARNVTLASLSLLCSFLTHISKTSSLKVIKLRAEREKNEQKHALARERERTLSAMMSPRVSAVEFIFARAREKRVKETTKNVNKKARDRMSLCLELMNPLDAGDKKYVNVCFEVQMWGENSRWHHQSRWIDDKLVLREGNRSYGSDATENRLMFWVTASQCWEIWMGFYMPVIN